MVTAVVAVRLQHGYVASLAANLRSGAVSLEDDSGLDMATRFTLIESRMDLDRSALLRGIEEHRAADGAPAERTPASTAVARMPASDQAASTAAERCGPAIPSAFAPCCAGRSTRR